jgi:hypothetical protein
MFDFVNKLEGARRIAIQLRRQARLDEETLRTFVVVYEKHARL